jgi:uncharacterized membrane protein
LALVDLILLVLILEVILVVYFAATAGYDCYPDCTIDQKVTGFAGVWVLPPIFLALVLWSVVRWLRRRRRTRGT